MSKSIPICSRALSTFIYSNFFISPLSTLIGKVIKLSENILFNFALQIATLMGPRSIKVSFLNLFLYQTILCKTGRLMRLKYKKGKKG